MFSLLIICHNYLLLYQYQLPYCQVVLIKNFILPSCTYKKLFSMCTFHFSIYKLVAQANPWLKPKQDPKQAKPAGNSINIEEGRMDA